MKLIAVSLTVVSLAGCSAVISDPAVPPVSPEVQVRIAELPQKYRQIAADALPSALSGISLAGAEISGLKRSLGPQPGDWATCVKTETSGKIDYFAVFYAEGNVVHVRRAVVIDNCPLAVFSPLPSKLPPAKAANSR